MGVLAEAEQERGEGQDDDVIGGEDGEHGDEKIKDGEEANLLLSGFPEGEIRQIGKEPFLDKQQGNENH